MMASLRGSDAILNRRVIFPLPVTAALLGGGSHVVGLKDADWLDSVTPSVSSLDEQKEQRSRYSNIEIQMPEHGGI